MGKKKRKEKGKARKGLPHPPKHKMIEAPGKSKGEKEE